MLTLEGALIPKLKCDAALHSGELAPDDFVETTNQFGYMIGPNHRFGSTEIKYSICAVSSKQNTLWGWF